MRTKTDLMAELRTLLNDVILARSRGADHSRLARAHGYLDGYMHALLESGIASSHELLSVVAEERHKVDGPATRDVACDEAAA